MKEDGKLGVSDDETLAPLLSTVFLALSSPETLVQILWGMKEKKGPQKQGVKDDHHF